MNIPFFSFYPADWLSDGGVQQLTLEEAGAYINILAYMWTNGKECNLPNDDKFISRILHVSEKKWKSIRKILVDGPKPVFYVSEGCIRNKRLDEEYRKATGIIKKRIEAAEKRWSDAGGKQNTSKSNANALQKDCNTDPDTDTDKDQKPATTTATVKEIVRAFEQMHGRIPSPVQIDKFVEYVNKGMDVSLITEVMKRTKLIEKTVQYLFGTLDSMLDTNILTLADAEEEQRQRKAQKQSRAGSGRPRRLHSEGSGGAKSEERDERYKAFYDLFPDA